MILVFILIIPGFLYYLLVKKGQNRYHPLPIYGHKTPAKTFHKVRGKEIPDTVYHTLSDFHLTDQNGKPVSFKTFDDKVFVVNFFYTHCPTVCKTVNSFMDSLARNYAKEKMVDFVSITVDPKNDSVAALKKYSEQFADHGPKWLFLGGDTATIYNLARKGFLVNAVDAGNGNYIYSDKMILIDTHKRIRGYYEGASFTDVTRLNDEIKVLVYEEIRNREEPLY
ncbi:MAG TPA: SCO family protein [Mucilaginibacter sp.]|nr:SCO family protein [Mucilaginibacter sp.]